MQKLYSDPGQTQVYVRADLTAINFFFPPKRTVTRLTVVVMTGGQITLYNGKKKSSNMFGCRQRKNYIAERCDLSLKSSNDFHTVAEIHSLDAENTRLISQRKVSLFISMDFFSPVACRKIQRSSSRQNSYTDEQGIQWEPGSCISISGDCCWVLSSIPVIFLTPCLS